MIKEASVPAKTFLIGEYAVLAGEKALVATLGPRFHAKYELSDQPGLGVPDGSPASRLFEWWSARNASEFGVRVDFSDPFRGTGGFGASSAQFALCYHALTALEGSVALESGAWTAWTAYREMAHGAILPSGADLVAQWMGGVVSFDPKSRQAQPLWNDNSFWQRLLIFSATGLSGRKVATHAHLADLAKNDREPVTQKIALHGVPFIHEAQTAIEASDSNRLGAALTSYANVLDAQGLECPAAREDREAFTLIEGVAGAKGSGAMLADAVVVALSTSGEVKKTRDRVLDTAHTRGLTLVADGICFQEGLIIA